MVKQKIPTINFEAELTAEQKVQLSKIKAGMDEELVPRGPKTAEERQMLEQLKKMAKQTS